MLLTQMFTHPREVIDRVNKPFSTRNDLLYPGINYHTLMYNPILCCVVDRLFV